MATARAAQALFAVTSLLLTVALVAGFAVTVAREGGRFDAVPARTVSFVAFFTVLSNSCVAVTTGLLAVRLDRTSTVFHVFRLVGVVSITVTGVVHYVALAGLVRLSGWELVVDTILHSVSPVLGAVGWLAFGPRSGLSPRIALLTAVPAVAWLLGVLLLGAAVRDASGRHYYAYPFMDVEVHGYAVALGRCALVAGLFLGLAFGAQLIDRHLPGVRHTTTPGGPGRSAWPIIETRALLAIGDEPGRSAPK